MHGNDRDQKMAHIVKRAGLFEISLPNGDMRLMGDLENEEEAIGLMYSKKAKANKLYFIAPVYEKIDQGNV